MAFVAEAAISFGMMLMVLSVSNTRALARFTGLASGLLVARYITLEAPLSGMSMNPARSFGPAVLSGTAGPLDLFRARSLGMLLAAELFVRIAAGEACAAPSCITRSTARASSAAETIGAGDIRAHDALRRDHHRHRRGRRHAGLSGSRRPGKRILLLERGDYVPREKDNWSSRAVNVEAKYNTKEVWHDKDGKPLHPHTNYYVGGNTKFYGAALFRLRKEDFGEIRHHGGISPAWPISYDELEPYYTQAEHLYQVHGERGVDPTEPWASAPYPFPAVQHEPRIQQLHDDLSSERAAPVPRAARHHARRGEPAARAAASAARPATAFPA